MFRILAVDDDEVDRRAFRRALVGASVAVEIVEADSADEAEARLAAERFDCVFLDLRMPGHDGRWLLTRLRERGDDVPVVMLTGHGDEETVVELMRGGATDYLTKASLTPERIARTLQQAMRLKDAERRARQAQQDLRAHVRQLATLAEVSARLLTCTRETDIVRLAADHGREMLAAGLVVVRLSGTPPLEAVSTGDVSVAARADASLPIPSIELTLVADAARIDGDERVRRVVQQAAMGLPARNALVVPLTVPGEAVNGVIVAADRRDGRELADADRALLEQLAHAVGTNLANARRLRRAEEAAQARKEVLEVVSGDLRSPLGVVRLALRAALSEAVGERATLYEQGLVAADNMDELIGELLDLARIDEGRLVVDRAPHRAASLVGDVVELMRPVATAKGVRLEVELGELPLVLVDGRRIRRVLQNLLVNAIEHTPTGGRAVVGAEPVRDMVRFAVSDGGPGIPAGKMTHLFDRFHRARHDPQDIGGIGLAIARGFVEAHGGTIWAYNRPGGGATLFFTVPAARAAVA